MYSDKVRTAQSQLALASRKDRATTKEQRDELHRNYTALKIAEFVEREVRKAPPLSPEQMAIISRAMRGQAAN